MKKIYKFNEGLKTGKEAEREFFNLFNKKLKLSWGDGHKTSDFYVNEKDGLELKTDYWSMSTTPNFFMEQYSYDKILGGPWQALQKGDKYFAYWFYKDNTVFFFNLQKLVDRLENIKNEYSMKNIKNEKHLTRGYAIPRTEFEDIYKKVSIS